MRKFRWQETVPNYLLTASARTARVRHAMQVIDGAKGTPRALCGIKPKFGWQHTTSDITPCVRCDIALLGGAYVELK